jgi:hypothetical protein
MSDQLSDELRHWLELLRMRHLNADAPPLQIPGVIRILLIKKKLARLRNGTIEITVDGIEELHRRA